MQTTSVRQARSPSLTALRRATAARHQVIESVIGLDGDWDMAHYARVLLGFHDYLSAWEPAVIQALPDRLRQGFTARSRLVFLQADLRALSSSFPWLAGQGPAASPRHLPGRSPRIPDMPGVAAAMGSLYVLEGSALGGQVIARRLLERHGRSTDMGGAYFSGWGPRTGAMWKGFLHTLSTELDGDAHAIDAACEAAVDTFDGLIHTFEAACA